MTDPRTDLERRLEALEAERDIRRLFHRYAECLDYGLADDFPALFTADGTWRLERLGDVVKTFTGHAELHVFASGHSHWPDAAHKHLVFDHEVLLDGDRGTATSYFLRVDRHPDRAGAPQIFEFGRYHDDLERGDDGRWLFRQRRVVGESW